MFLHQVFSHISGCISSTGTSPVDTVGTILYLPTTTGAGGTRGRDGAIYHIESPKRIHRSLMIFGRFGLSRKDRISQC